MNDNNRHYEAGRGSLKTYVSGFVLSVILTMAAYLLVQRHSDSGNLSFSRDSLIISVVVLAVVQLFVQLIFFLHLSRESKPRWNLIVFSFAAMVVLIVVLGSLWIMNSLKYNHEHAQSPTETSKRIIEDEGIGR